MANAAKMISDYLGLGSKKVIRKSPRGSLNYTATPPVNARTSVSDVIRVLEGFISRALTIPRRLKFMVKVLAFEWKEVVLRLERIL
ncbi:hypothetical protein H5410_011184 [Solanum commersonii]|uniref:Uncharacterized protein n=1 Tax=Solanum commersonii TaxID=4109 RepID=A0A9J6AMY1_SOLCO|nr:hypothetical protein H5410_011184 [Solanum commersonii]